MADLTPTLGLIKPTIAENILVETHLNPNSDAIDAFATQVNADIATTQANIDNQSASLLVPWTDVANPAISGMTLGTTGTKSMRYKVIGKTAFVSVKLTFSGGSVTRTNRLRLDLSPVGPRNPTHYDAAVGHAVGNCSFWQFVNGTVSGTIGGVAYIGDPADTPTYADPLQFRLGVYPNGQSNLSLPFGDLLASTPFSSYNAALTGTLTANFVYELA